MKYINLLVIILIFVFYAPLSRAETMRSPDESIALSFDIDNEGKALYSISYLGKDVISSSSLGFQFTDSDQMRRGFKLLNIEHTSHDSTWEQPWGERQFVRDHYNEMLVDILHDWGKSNRKLRIRFRLFNNGVGFRYEFPEQNGFETANIAEEITEFNLSGDGDAWWIPAGDWNRYEYLYHKTATDSVSTAHTPVTIKFKDGPHIAIHEASLVDYSSMWLKRIEGNKFRSQLAPSSRGAKVVRDLPFHTPWRTIRISSDAAGLYDNDIDLNLNEPNKLGDVSWFVPHKYIGIWWEMHLNKSSWSSGSMHGATTANALHHIDFAAQHGFRGVLIEGWNIGWDGNWFGNGRDYNFTQAYPDFDIDKVAQYAREKNIKIIGHHETGGNIKNYERQLDAAMAYYNQLGIDAVKTGYVADAGAIIAPSDDGNGEIFEWHDGQRMAQHHLSVVKTAARYKIAINPHEPIKATGLRRTYPNWISREGARGGEYQAWGDPKNSPSHVPTLVFTRMLSGPMDYTPGILSLVGRDRSRIESTLARQLALYIILYSPIQMAADLPENLIKYPRELQFISDVPTDWSLSKTIAGEVGQYAVMARKDRNSEAWYVGGVTDNKQREISIKLDFLDPNKNYKATIYQDGPNADGLGDDRHDIIIKTIEKQNDQPLSTSSEIQIKMVRAGGFAIRFEPT